MRELHVAELYKWRASTMNVTEQGSSKKESLMHMHKNQKSHNIRRQVSMMHHCPEVRWLPTKHRFGVGQAV